MSVLLASHCGGLTESLVEAACFLDNLFAVVQELFLALYLDFDGACYRLEGVQVFQLGPGAEFVASLGGDGDVDVAADRALFHLAVAYSCVLEEQHYLFKVRYDFLSAVEVRLGNYLDKRNSAAVVIREGNTVHFVVYELARVLFKMDSVDADILFLAACVYLNGSCKANRARHLRYLVSFRQVGVEVVLSVPFCEAGNFAVHNITRFDDVFYSLSVEHGERSGKSAANRAASGIRRAAEFGRAGAEHL